MEIHIMTRRELSTLSLLSGFDTLDSSPIADLVDGDPSVLDDGQLAESAQRLVDANYLVPRRDTGALDVNPFFLMELKVLFEPQEVAAFYFSSTIDGPEAFFLRRSRSWVHYMPAPGHEFHTFCAMPPEDGWRTWLREQLEARMTRATDPVLERTHLLTAIEWATVLIIQEVLRSRAEDGPLDDERAAFSAGDVYSLIDAGDAALPSLMLLPSMLAAVEALYTDRDAIATTLGRLVESGFLMPYAEGRFLYTPFAKSTLDPGRVVEHAHVSWRREDGDRAVAGTAAIIVHDDKVVIIDSDPSQMLVRFVVRSPANAVRFLDNELLTEPFGMEVPAVAEFVPADPPLVAAPLLPSTEATPPSPITVPTEQAGACSSCGAPLKPGTRFCTTCGTPVTAVAPACVACGSELNEGAGFCSRCGTPVA